MSSLERQAQDFGSKLEATKGQLTSPPGFTWYPYDSLKSFAYTVSLLDREACHLLEEAGAGTVLDIGCGDGDIAFLFESLGAKVTAVDYPAPNWNKMCGVKLLMRTLHSSVELRELDLDSQFTIPEQERYDLGLLLGVLYHLQNPFHVLAHLARHCEYCLLNTRVARFTPDRKCHYNAEPMAYLVDAGEVNNDDTNYWIFSEAGLRRILKRTRWEICDFVTAGNTRDSDPVSAAGDERAIVLLRSTA